MKARMLLCVVASATVVAIATTVMPHGRVRAVNDKAVVPVRKVATGATTPPSPRPAWRPVRPGWIAVEGGERLAAGSLWKCADRAVVTEFGGEWITTAGTEFATPINMIGPHLEISGDFGVVVTLATRASSLGTIMLVASMSASEGSALGMKRFEFGLEGGAVRVLRWDGTREGPTLSKSFGSGLSGKVKLEALRRGGQMVLYADGTEVGRVSHQGMFDRGTLYLGANVAPGNELTVDRLSVIVPVSAPFNVKIVSPLGEVAAVANAPTLRTLAEGKGLQVGAQVPGSVLLYGSPGVAGRRIRETFVAQFGIGVLPTYFSLVQPRRAGFDFCDPDMVAYFAEANGIQLFGHPLVWHEGLPDWVGDGTQSPLRLRRILREHIKGIVRYYRGRVHGWDVVNEAIDGRTGRLRRTIWYKALGRGYIEHAFKWAHEADPDARLFYNDFEAEGLGPKSDAVYELVKGLVRDGVPIHGVGMQAHFALDPASGDPRTTSSDAPSVADIRANMKRLGELGLEVRISEIDVRMEPPFDRERLLAQAQIYSRTLHACIKSPNCSSFVTWGMDDGTSWIPDVFPGFGAAHIFDADLQPKPAFRSLMRELRR